MSRRGWDCPEFSQLDGLLVSRGLECHVYGLKLDRGEFTEAALATPAVVAPLDPDDDRQAQFFPGRPPLPVEDVLLQ